MKMVWIPVFILSFLQLALKSMLRQCWADAFCDLLSVLVISQGWRSFRCIFVLQELILRVEQGSEDRIIFCLNNCNEFAEGLALVWCNILVMTVISCNYIEETRQRFRWEKFFLSYRPIMVMENKLVSSHFFKSRFWNVREHFWVFGIIYFPYSCAALVIHFEIWKQEITK
jgi:hypothetical protein